MSNDLQQQFVRDMLTESLEGLDRYERVILELEQGAPAEDRLNEIFRVVHTLKGTAGCLGFNQIQRVAHVGEGLLDDLRAGRRTMHPAISSSLLKLSDALREHLNAIDQTGVESTADFTAVTTELQNLRDRIVPAAAQTPAPAPAPAAPAPTPAPAEPEAVGNATWGLFDDEAPAAPAAEDASATWGLFEPAAPEAGPAPAPSAPAAPSGTPNAEATPARGASAASGSVRVDIALLDRMMNLVGELVLARNQLGQVSQTRAQRPEAILEISQRINLVTGELQESVMKTRMQPIETVWGKFPRIVRDLAKDLGKQVKLDTFGSETELDRTIIEAIRDPLTHIVRNSVDHGLETPERRLAAGKSPEGSLIMRAFHEGGQVIIEIIDDGAGVNITRVKAKAVERGLLTPEQAARLGDREAVNLIFAPGFSTAEQVTNISGRGVGMDVVKTNIEKIGGSVEVQSTAGQGTSLKIKIPLTLAIIPALLIRSGEQRFAIPQVNLLELVRLEGQAAEEALEHVYDSPVFRLRGQLLPLVFLDREFKFASGSLDRAPSSLSIVVLQADDRRFGLVVGAVCDTQEIVVKPLSAQLKGLPMFAGATILGDGRVALILDVLGLAKHARVAHETRVATTATTMAATATTTAATTQFLLFDIPGRSRLALPLDKAARLEEFAADQVEKSGNREAIQYRDGILPLVRLDRVLPGAHQRPPTGRLPVIVYRQGEKTFGLVVHQITDIVEDHLRLQEGTAAPGICGSAIIQGAITDLIDVPAILRAAERVA